MNRVGYVRRCGAGGSGGGDSGDRGDRLPLLWSSLR